MNNKSSVRARAQFYNGFSGQSMVDDISAAAFNVLFTSVPILLFAVLDRPVHRIETLLRYPQVGRPCSATPRWAACMPISITQSNAPAFIMYLLSAGSPLMCRVCKLNM